MLLRLWHDVQAHHTGNIDNFAQLRQDCHPWSIHRGHNPLGPLIQGTDGNFYGVTQYFGRYGHGTVFKSTQRGVVTTLHNFCPDACFDGPAPTGPLVEATNEDFYGTAIDGTHNAGKVFKISPGGKFGNVYNFCAQANCTDGAFPNGVVQANDGNFYGMTDIGGTSGNCVSLYPGCGTVFRLTPGGKLTTLHNFDGADGKNPGNGLLQLTSGTFVGIAGGGT